jgi:hypothetical protein
MDFTKILTTALPWIGAAATGNVPALIAMAAKEVGQALGVTVDATPGAIGNAVANATPEQLLALKEADQNFELQMKALGFANIKDLEAIAAADRDSARKLQMASPSIVPAALSIIVTVGFLGVLICMMKGWLTTDSSDALLLMLGSLGTAWTSVMAFWFGTTRQSENKTTMLAAAPSVK